jgi:hypothetical protein
LDILVNNVWGGYEYFSDGTEVWKETGFWTVPIPRWDAMFQAGVRAHYVASVLAAPIMIAQHTGLIVNISFFAAQRDDKSVHFMYRAKTKKYTVAWADFRVDPGDKKMIKTLADFAPEGQNPGLDLSCRMPTIATSFSWRATAIVVPQVSCSTPASGVIEKWARIG